MMQNQPQVDPIYVALFLISFEKYNFGLRKAIISFLFFNTFSLSLYSTLMFSIAHIFLLPLLSLQILASFQPPSVYSSIPPPPPLSLSLTFFYPTLSLQTFCFPFNTLSLFLTHRNSLSFAFNLFLCPRRLPIGLEMVAAEAAAAEALAVVVEAIFL